jgi:rhamnopyranosyl-N-acetylglucosaminyl-diphospho-decaprenol beta-1,3/1,4-galactofuranosyltransferase
VSERVCVVIVTFNNANMLAKLLDDLRIQTRLPDGVIVVDNASRDHTENTVREDYPEVKYVKLKENLGSAGGYHEGIRRAIETADFIYTLDDDVRLKPNTLAEIIQGFHVLEKTSEFRIGAVRSVGEGHPQSVPTPLEICPWRGTLFKTRIVREVGLPSPDYFLYGEDIEYSLRLAKRGYCFYWIPASICQEDKRKRDGKAEMGLFKKRGTRYQDPFRLYYAFRSEISIYLNYCLFMKLLHTILYAMKVVLMILAKEGLSGRVAIGAIAAGIRDGFRRKLGKNSRYSPAEGESH